MARNLNFKKGTSLIEVIIVLAVVSLTILGAMGLIARTRIEIKNNELEDKSNTLLLKVSEIFKNPTGKIFNESINFIDNTNYFFTFKPDSNGTFTLNYLPSGSYFVALPKENINNNLKFADICNSRSPFYIVDSSGFIYCQQVLLTKISGQNINTKIYKIEINLVYESTRGLNIQNFTTYKYGDF